MGFCRFLVDLSPEFRRDHEDDFLLVFDFEEKAVIPDAIPPRFGRMALQLFDILSEIRWLSQLGVDVSSQFGGYFFSLSTGRKFSMTQTLESSGIAPRDEKAMRCPSGWTLK